MRRLCRHVPRVSRRSSSIGSRAEATSTACRCRQSIRRNCWSSRSPPSRASPEPLKIDYGFVDYDISSVDQVYLSVAMDPVNNPFIGFIGSVLGRDIFSARLTKFRNDFSWPKYKWPAYVTNQTAIRLPATFNVMNEIAHPGAPPPFEPAGAAIKALPVVQKMEKLWDECCGEDWPSKPCQKPSASSNTCNNMAQVAKLFEKNYDNYKKLCKTPVKLDRDQMMANVYGWVPFNSCVPGWRA